jgi:hypothetical protein
MKTLGRGGVTPSFLDSALGGGEWSASHPGCFAMEKLLPPQYPLNRRLGGPHIQSGQYGEEKDLSPPGNRMLSVQPVVCYCTNRAIPALLGIMAKRKIPATCSCLESSSDFWLVAGPLLFELTLILLKNFILWRIDPFVGSDCETNSETTFSAREQILISKNRRPLLGNGLVNTFPWQRICAQQ